MIQALPTALSLGLIALFAYPKSRTGNVKNLKIYYKYLASFFILIFLIGIATIQDAIVLANLDNYVQDNSMLIQICVIFSAIALFSIPIFLVIYLLAISKFEVEENKIIRVF